MWYALIIAFFIEFLAILFIVPKSWVVAAINEERAATARWFGNERTLQMIDAAQARYNSIFVDSGFKEQVYYIFYVRQNKEAVKGMEWATEDNVFRIVAERIDTVFLLLKAIMFRLDLIMISLVLALMVMIPTLIDGLCNWQINRNSDENTSINIYNMAEWVFYTALILPFYVILLPTALTPILFTVWMFFVCISMHTVASKLQHRI
jgi:hypothetical protein